MSSQLDAIKARAEAASHANHTTTMNYNAVYSVVWRSHQDIPALVAAVEAVLELHKPWAVSNPSESTVNHCCDQCYEAGTGDFVPYPCPTVAAIQSALGEGEK